MLTIHYFASIRETLELAEETLEKPDHIETVADLIEHLSAQHPALKTLANDAANLQFAVNQTIVQHDCLLGENDEIAFFPPMTGG